MTITFPAKSADPQAEYSVAVVMPTLLRPTIEKAIRSIYAQRVKGTIQIMIGIDRDLYDGKPLLDRLIEERPGHVAVTVLDLGYSTFTRNGGLYNVIGGGALRPILTLMAHSRYVAFLDDDNWWHQDHLPLLLEAIQGHDYAFSQLLFCTPEGSILGYHLANLYRKRTYQHHTEPTIDPNILLIDKIRIQDHLLKFVQPLYDNYYGEDINFSYALYRNYCGVAVKFFTVYYRCCFNENDQETAGYIPLEDKFNNSGNLITIVWEKWLSDLFESNLWKRLIGKAKAKDKVLLLEIGDSVSLDVILRTLIHGQIVIAVPPPQGWSWNETLDGMQNLPEYLQDYVNNQQLILKNTTIDDYFLNEENALKFEYILWQFDESIHRKWQEIEKLYKTILLTIHETKAQLHIKSIDKTETAAMIMNRIAKLFQITPPLVRPTNYELVFSLNKYLVSTHNYIHKAWKGDAVIYDILGQAPMTNNPKMHDLTMRPLRIDNDLLAIWRQHRPQIYGYVPEDDRVIACWAEGMQASNAPNKAIFFKLEKLGPLVTELGIEGWQHQTPLLWVDDNPPPNAHPNVPNLSIYWLDGKAIATLLIPSENKAYKPLSGDVLVKAVRELWCLLLYQQRDQQLLAHHIHNQSLGLHLPALCQPFLATLKQAWPSSIVLLSRP